MFDGVYRGTGGTLLDGFLCSQHFGGGDVARLHEALSLPKPWTERPVVDAMSTPPGARGGWLLSWAVANRRLDIRVAVVTGRDRTIDHEKIGVFETGGGVVAFEGSANESAAAYFANIDRVVVYSREFGRGSAAVAVHSQYERLWRTRRPGSRLSRSSTRCGGGFSE